jgi:rhodanese-related sulfurtransferase
VEFIQQNIWLVLIALASGGVLVWPLIARGLSGAREVGALEAVQMINRRDAVLVDLREPAEFGAGHAPHARNVPHSQLDTRIGELEKAKAKPIVLVCQTGGKSHAAISRFKKAGFSEVVVLAGGMGAWQQASLPVEK